MTSRRDVAEDCLVLVATALKVRLAVDLGRHRLARRTLADLSTQVSVLRPQVDTLAVAGDRDSDVEITDMSLDELLAEKWPPGSFADPLADLLPESREVCER
jgi:hypothetical protein